MVRGLRSPLVIKTKASMKRTLGVFLGLGIVIGIGYVTLGGDTTIEYDRPEVSSTSTDAVVKPTAAELLESATQELIIEAITASSSDIEAAKKEAADRIEKEMHLKIERAVRLQITDSNDGALEKIEADLSF
jgi:hypothetical protein